ncbi:MAG TPA: alpha/beta hydrolase [Trebonia sp.]|nr:alpha/beta hydrolase [Trebonia sp.]
MAVSPRFHVQSTGARLRNGFPYFAHHDSVSALWSLKWRRLCAAGIYPFTGARAGDFDPVFAVLAKASGDDPAIVSQPDEYARPFFPAAARLVAEAEEALSGGGIEAARDLLLRAAAVYKIARFPVNRSPLSQDAWEKGKAVHARADQLLDPPRLAVEIPFTQADTSAGDLDAAIPAYLRVPRGARPAGGWPVVLVICGLDSFRTDQIPRTQAHADRGQATLTFEIPGVGDCPAAPGDPAAPDRLMSSILEWVTASAPAYQLDHRTIIARGVSTGGYYAARLAHTHGRRLLAAVAQGGGAHHMFDAEWIGAQNQMEYAFDLADALAYKFGYRQQSRATAIARYASEASKFSLLDSGVLEAPSCKLLLVNGMEDSIFPIEDSIAVATQGVGKDLVALGGQPHMGLPGSEAIIHEWIDRAITESH